MSLTYVKPEKISLKEHPEYNEKWVQGIIADDPSILDLGDLEVKDIEKSLPSGGRLDMLLVDSDSDKRYEVELMLGEVNESHIVRCIEYWDIERKRYPQYDHAAVLVAEDITTRFLNVISLFNNSIPMIAIQMEALRLDEKIMLNFTKVLDEVIPGDDTDNGGEAVDRDYWEKKGSKESLKIMDKTIEILKEIDSSLQQKYNKHYIGITASNKVKNFVLFRAKKKFVKVEAKIKEHDQWIPRLEEAGIVFLGISKSRNWMRFQLKMSEVDENRELLKEIFEACYKAFEGE